MQRFLEHILLNYLLGQVKPLNRPETVDNIGQPMYAEPEISVCCTTEITQISKRCLKEGVGGWDTHTQPITKIANKSRQCYKYKTSGKINKYMDVCIYIFICLCIFICICE